MLATIDLDDQPMFTTEKIGKVRSDWKLPNKFMAAKALGLQGAPYYGFGIIIGLTQRSRSYRCSKFSAGTRDIFRLGRRRDHSVPVAKISFYLNRLILSLTKVPLSVTGFARATSPPIALGARKGLGRRGGSGRLGED